MKTCSKCQLAKPLADFSCRRTTKDGYHPWCKTCHCTYQRALYRKHHPCRVWQEISGVTKQCRCCLKEQSVSAFPKNRYSRDGLYCYCRSCCHDKFSARWFVRTDILHHPSLEDRFWQKVIRSDDLDACWLWTSARGFMGYGLFRLSTGSVSAHRYSFELTYGPITKGLYVLHKCDVPLCVNPQHLFLGTAADNYHDGVRKGRIIPGRRPAGTSNGIWPHIDRSAIIIRDRSRCHLCRRVVKNPGDLVLDHLIPRSEGGPTTPENLAVAHRLCNLRRIKTLIIVQLRLF